MLYFSLVGSKVEVIFCFHGLVELLRTTSFKVDCPEPLFFSSHDRIFFFNMDAYECHAFYQSQQFQLSTAGL
jgi:hypothetical protein